MKKKEKAKKEKDKRGGYCKNGCHFVKCDRCSRMGCATCYSSTHNGTTFCIQCENFIFRTLSSRKIG